MSLRVVLDTNVLVAAAYAPQSASRRIVQAAVDAAIVPVASTGVRREYESILAKAVRVGGYDEQLAALLEALDLVEPTEVPRRVAEDPDDDKFLAAAEAGRAGWIVTNDRHLLALDPLGAIRIVPPGVFVGMVWDE